MKQNLFPTKEKRMRKWLSLCCLSMVILCAGPGMNVADAQKGGGRSYSSGGGRSYSSGSGGRSYSSGSGRSYSSGSGGRSYSAGGSSGGRSYSSGGGSSMSARSPASSTGGSATGRSYSSGGSPSRPPGGSSSPPGGSYPPSANPNRPPASVGSSGKNYSAGRGSDATAGAKPSRKSYDVRAAEAQRHDESRAAFRKGQEPRTSYVDPKGVTRNIDPRDAEIRQLRQDLDYERWSNRSWRMRTFYGDYYWGRPIVYYHDPYNSFFWWWLLDQTLETQALWAYHHRYAMDQARYNALITQNASLAARVSQLEAQNTARDPSYVPPNFQQRDLMYTDNYVHSIYNPQRPPVSFWHVIWVIMKFMLFFALVAFLIWLVFFKRWGAAAVYS